MLAHRLHVFFEEDFSRHHVFEADTFDLTRMSILAGEHNAIRRLGIYPVTPYILIRETARLHS